MKELFKKIFYKPTVEEESCFYSFKRIYELRPRHYIILNCTEGFGILMKRSSIPCDVNGSTVEVTTTGGLRRITYGNENFAEILTLIKKGEY